MSAGESEPGRRRTHLPEAVAVLFLAVAVYILVTNILPTRRTIESLLEETDRVTRRNEELREEISRSNRLSDALETDPATVERETRESLRITRPGERILREDSSDRTRYRGGR